MTGGEKKKKAEPALLVVSEVKKRLHNYSAAPWQPSLPQRKCAVMEPSGDLINLLIEGKEHLFTVNEQKHEKHPDLDVSYAFHSYCCYFKQKRKRCD